MSDAVTDTDLGIRVLSLDSGGPGTYSQLLIIREYMTRIVGDLGVNESDLYPADYFEMMGGVGFGGLIAVMFGHLRMSVEEAVDGLLAVASAIFPPDAAPTVDAAKNSAKLKEAIENLLHARELPVDLKMNDRRHPCQKCKVAVYAANLVNINHPTVFRTYTSRGTSLNPTIVDAICATIAVYPIFLPVKIGPRMREQSFAGGALGANNPTRELLKEAGSVFGKEKRAAQILSIGTGRPRLPSLDQPTREGSGVRIVDALALDCETVAKELSTRLLGIDGYLRLNVDEGMENSSFNDWTSLGTIESHTAAYLEITVVTKALDASLQRLHQRLSSVTFGQINHSSTIKVTAKVAPAVSPSFVMRIREWQYLLDHLVESRTPGRKIFRITGIGGCGKTQMVSYFLQEKGDMYTHNVFVDASSETSIKSDLHGWARSLGDGHEKSAWEDGLQVLAREPPERRWILVLDNANDPNLQLVPFFPKCENGTILITSRNRNVGSLSNTHHLEMGQMERDEALSTLLKAAQRHPPLAPDELESANALMDELGCLPDALVRAGTYCRQMSSTVQGIPHPYSFVSYLSLFYSQRDALLKRTGPSTLDGYQRGI